LSSSKSGPAIEIPLDGNSPPYFKKTPTFPNIIGVNILRKLVAGFGTNSKVSSNTNEGTVMLCKPKEIRVPRRTVKQELLESERNQIRDRLQDRISRNLTYECQLEEGFGIIHEILRNCWRINSRRIAPIDWNAVEEAVYSNLPSNDCLKKLFKIYKSESEIASVVILQSILENTFGVKDEQ
jgi:hypothetical protein